ncbi:MAG TPA: prolyl oligopeptidase family serine peptidase [Terriglobales bacterium]|nr:prolyl oligopeptidase family serine peptidase [Terriglobales bacterium]
MKNFRQISLVLLFALLMLTFANAQSSAQAHTNAQAMSASATPAASSRIEYPETKKIEQVDDYHGTKVSDPYRWLENGSSAETAAWIEAENKVTFGYLNNIAMRTQIKDRLTKLWNYERYGTPFKQGGRYFYTRNNGLQNQSVLLTAKSLTEEPKVVLDPNLLSKDGTVALSGYDITEDGKHIVYGVAMSGSDWTEWRVRDIETGQDTVDHIKWVKFSNANSTKDGKGFYYSRYDEPKQASMLRDAVYFHKLYFHKLGTPQTEDVLVYDRPDHKDWNIRGSVTDDGKYLIINISQGTDRKNRVYYKDLATKDAPVVKLLDEFDASYSFIDNVGPVFYMITDLDAPNEKVISIDTRNPARSNWKTLIAEGKEPISSVNIVNNMFIARYLKDARSVVKILDLKGKPLRDVALPGLGTVGGFGGRRADVETFYSFNSYTSPSIIYRYDMKSGASTVFKQPKVDFDPANYETKQIFFTSKDGTKVPMFVSHKKGLKLNGQNATYLHGYGGFNISQTPGFSVANMVWMEMGGVFAVANLRGGGEYGKEWHLAGTKLRKQNVFDDFIGAAEWLIANKYTSTPKLAIGGGSNGGLLVGAVLNQRPDLYGAALPAVGVMDMLRFHKFTIGWAWTSDYGSADNPEEFKAIYAYSPLHNIKPGTKYPAVMVTTADHDDRVVPAHSFKYASALQAAQAGDAPILIRIQTKAGHGAGKPVTMQIEEQADRWAFLMNELNAQPPLGN